MIRPKKKRRTGVDKSGLPFSFRPPPSKRERRAERRPVILGLRIAVLRRARGKCEFMCTLRGEPTEAHHVLGGASRVSLESEYSLAALCETCHEETKAKPAWAREQGLSWALRMAAAAKFQGDQVAEAGFRFTAEQLEGRIALAAAQEGPPRG